MDRRDIQSPSLPTNILCIYAQRDESFYRELQTHLSIWQREGHIHWPEIVGGDDIEQTIQTQIQKADLILLLISPDFFSDDSCHQAMTTALLELKKRQVSVVPVLARASGWKRSACGRLNALPNNKQPITSWDDPDQAYKRICDGLECFIFQAPVSSLTPPSLPHFFRPRIITIFLSLGILIVIVSVILFYLGIFHISIPSVPLNIYHNGSSPIIQNQTVTPSPTPSPSMIQNQAVTPSPVPSSTLDQVLYIPAPGCGAGANSLQYIYRIAQPFICPISNVPGYNPYNDFGAKDEAAAVADTSVQAFTITGTANIKPFNLDCTKECIFQANILFHKEDTTFRQSTVIGIAIGGYGISIDRNGDAYKISKGSYNLTSLSSLPNFPPDNDVTANNNPINLEIIYLPGKNLSFLVTYKDSLHQAFETDIPSTDVGINSSNFCTKYSQSR